MNGCKEKKMEGGEIDWEYIHVYSREDAISDGEIVDVSEMAKEAGFCIPVAVTRAVHATCVEVREGVHGQDEAGRLWDILWMTRHSISTSGRPCSSVVPVKLYVRNTNGSPKPVTLKAVCGPGDDGEPVLTVMYPDED